jgi:hypothetical protein
MPVVSVQGPKNEKTHARRVKWVDTMETAKVSENNVVKTDASTAPPTAGRMVPLERRAIVIQRPTKIRTLPRRTTKKTAATKTPPSLAWFGWPKNKPGIFSKLTTQKIFAANWGANRPGDVTARLQLVIDICYNRTVVEKRGPCEAILGPNFNCE